MMGGQAPLSSVSDLRSEPGDSQGLSVRCLDTAPNTSGKRGSSGLGRGEGWGWLRGEPSECSVLITALCLLNGCLHNCVMKECCRLNRAPRHGSWQCPSSVAVMGCLLREKG